MWTVILVLWAACCFAGLVASGYGLYELATAYREPKKKPEEVADAVVVAEDAEVVGDAVVAEEVDVDEEVDIVAEDDINTVDRSLVIDMSEDDDDDWEAKTK